jgi:hypothetical protein
MFQFQRFTFRFLIVLVLVLALAIGIFTPGLAAGLEQEAGPPTLTELVVQAVAIAAFMATVSNRLVAGLVTPIWEKFNLDNFWLMYVAWAVGGILVWITHVNIFADFVPNPLTGQILTALVSGGGANIIHDLFDKR